jgi:hypothetical protein
LRAAGRHPNGPEISASRKLQLTSAKGASLATMGLVNQSITATEATRIRHLKRGPFREQVSFLRRQFLQGGDLPFTHVLTEDVVTHALAALSGWLDRIFSPLVTLGVFLGQVFSADHSCRAAVARLIAFLLSGDVFR